MHTKKKMNLTPEPSRFVVGASSGIIIIMHFGAVENTAGMRNQSFGRTDDDDIEDDDDSGNKHGHTPRCSFLLSIVFIMKQN